jgi:uncharacterized membrane protein (UPF0127 family)
VSLRAWPATAVAGLVLLGSMAIGGSAALAAPASATKADLARAVARARAAHAPFQGLTQTKIRIGNQTLKVVVADGQAERVQGLRKRSTLGDYDGMLFAFGGPTQTGFTMSTVPVSLDIGFYKANGTNLDRFRMFPCAGSDATCPVYHADGGPFTYVVETLKDGLPKGNLRAAR